MAGKSKGMSGSSALAVAFMFSFFLTIDKDTRGLLLVLMRHDY
jgi:hypothetical protein